MHQRFLVLRVALETGPGWAFLTAFSQASLMCYRDSACLGGVKQFQAAH